jgi:hypothetical protein
MYELDKIKFHKIAQYRNALRIMRDSLAYEGQNEDGSAKLDYSNLPSVTVHGTVKLHGTNASIVYHENGDISFHSKEKHLATRKADGSVEFISDNANFAGYMLGLVSVVVNLVKDIENQFEVSYPIKICGEWCGEGIQKGVGISNIPKSFFIFGVKVGENWHTNQKLNLSTFNVFNIYDINAFPTYCVEIDFDYPEKAGVEFEKITLEVEECCPVAKLFGESDCTVGEGLVWTPNHEVLRNNTGTWFKTKGQKHSSSRVKKVASVDPDKIENILQFVDYSVTENRLNQGVDIIGLDQKLIGDYLSWIVRDIMQEESDVLVNNNLTIKDVSRNISNKARNFYMAKL